MFFVNIFYRNWELLFWKYPKLLKGSKIEKKAQYVYYIYYNISYVQPISEV